MSNAPADDKLPRLLSLSVHEFRTPLSVVSGWLRMVLKSPEGTLDDRHRGWLLEAQKSCDRLTMLVSEMSDLSALESGTASFKSAPIELRSLLAEAIASLAPVPDRPVDVELVPGTGPDVIQGDAPRLKTALSSVLFGLRREVVSSDRLIVRERSGEFRGSSASWISIADPDGIDAVSATVEESLTPFNEWRGGCGLSLPIARRIINGHGGAIWSAADDTKSAVIVLPH